MTTPIRIYVRPIISYCLFALFFFYNSAESVIAADYLGPDTVVASKDGKVLYVACKDVQEIVVADAAECKLIGKIELPANPTGMALHPDGTKLYVTCAAPGGAVCVVETASNKIVDTIPSGPRPIGPAVTPDGKRLYICNRFESKITTVDLASGKKLAVVPAIREPYSAAATPDGRSVFASNLLPLDRADSGNVAAVITAIDLATNESTAIRLPIGSTGVRGLCVSPDGKYVYVVHMLARYLLPTTQLERGWINSSALSIVDACAKKLLNTVSLDDVDLGAADPWGVTTSADGKWICVTHAGTHELSLIDAPGLLDKLAKLGESPATISPASDVSYDLAFLVDLRRRIKLEGIGPHGVAVIGNRAYVAEYFSDTVGVVDMQSDPPKLCGRIPLGPKPKLDVPRRGKMLFNDATMSFQHWQSCASCHPDARMDGLNWDLLNDGIGNPKDTRSLVNVHESGAVMALAVRDSAKAAIKAGIRGVMFAERPDEDAEAIDQYFSSLVPVPSPRLIDGKLSPAALRGKKTFFNPKIGCAFCHSEPYYTDKRAHDVSSVGPLDKPGDKYQTPRLIELWRTAPYMHDGRYVTVKELLVEGKHGVKYGDLGSLSDKDLDDLVEFLLSL